MINYATNGYRIDVTRQSTARHARSGNRSDIGIWHDLDPVGRPPSEHSGLRFLFECFVFRDPESTVTNSDSMSEYLWAID